MTKPKPQPTPKMNPELKLKWLQALRGGSYEQGKEALLLEDKFCCLGVLCDIGLPEIWENTGWGFASFHPWSDPNSELLNQTALEELQLSDELQRRLADMNDQGKTFEEIAEVIEAEA